MLLGFNAQVVQLLLFREALILSSGSEASLGLSLAAWALFNGFGSLLGWILLKGGVRFGRLFSGLLLILPVVAALSVHGARLARTLTDVPAGEPLRLALFSCLAVLVLAPVTFLDGFLFASALDGLFGKRAGGRGTSFVYGTESIGSLLGGLIFTFVLVAVMDPFAVAGILLCMNVLFLPMTEGICLFRAGWPGRGIRFLLFIAGVLALAFGPAMNAASEAARWNAAWPEFTLKETRETRYQNLALLQYGDKYSVYGNGCYLFDLRARPSSEFGDWDRAVYPHFGMLQHEGPRDVLLLGGGSKGYLNDMLLYNPRRVDWVEYDQGLVDLVKQYQIPEEEEGFSSPKVFYHPEDGRYFLKGADNDSLDLILADVPDPSNANLNRYYTLEFFRECCRALREGGVLVMGLSCQPNYIGEDVRMRNGSVFRSLKETFPHVMITAGDFSFMVAGQEDARISVDADEIVRRYEERGLTTERFSPYMFPNVLEAFHVEWINDLFAKGLAEGAFDPNTDDRPLAYFADAKLFASITGSKGEEEFVDSLEAFLLGAGDGIPSLAGRWLLAVLPGLGLGLYGISALRMRRGGGERSRRLLLLLTAAATGFTGIILEMGILIAFQNSSGYLYSQMGVIIAMYMAGLAFGALYSFKGSSRRSPFLWALTIMAAAIVFAVLILPSLGGVLPGHLFTLAAYAFITCLLGASGGLAFQGVSKALEDMGSAGGGMIYALDILGTCLGGWQAGNILIPHLGIHMTLGAAGGVAVVMFLFCAMALRRAF